MRSEESGLTTNVICDWSDISLLCSKLSALLDRFDEDRFRISCGTGKASRNRNAAGSSEGKSRLDPLH